MSENYTNFKSMYTNLKILFGVVVGLMIIMSAVLCAVCMNVGIKTGIIYADRYRDITEHNMSYFVEDPHTGNMERIVQQSVNDLRRERFWKSLDNYNIEVGEE